MVSFVADTLIVYGINCIDIMGCCTPEHSVTTITWYLSCFTKWIRWHCLLCCTVTNSICKRVNCINPKMHLECVSFKICIHCFTFNLGKTSVLTYIMILMNGYIGLIQSSYAVATESWGNCVVTLRVLYSYSIAQ